MKKRNRGNVTKSIVGMGAAFLLLWFGAYAFVELKWEGEAICALMCSLYLAIWVQAAITRDSLNAKLDEIKEAIVKSRAGEKVVK